MLDYVCEELIVEIFTRLPSKSLVRFRSLSKSLCYCISSRDFVHIHTIRSPQKLLLSPTPIYKQEEYFYTVHGKDQLPLCTKYGYIGIRRIDIPFGKNAAFVGLCNGILCFFDRKEKHMNLWNPSIKHILRLPDCSRKSGVRWYWIGFGFDPISDDYKIIWKSARTAEGSFVYAVKTRTWCEIECPEYLTTNWLSKPCFVNGVLHWMVHQYKSLHRDLPFILTFDLNTHVFGMIPLDDPSWQWKTTIQGSLALIYFGVDLDNSWIRVWRDASWSVDFKLRTANNGDLLPDTWCWGKVNQVYNPKTGARSRVVDFNAGCQVMSILPFNETLHLLDIKTAYEENQPRKKTSKGRHFKDLFYYFQFIFKHLCNSTPR